MFELLFGPTQKIWLGSLLKMSWPHSADVTKVCQRVSPIELAPSFPNRDFTIEEWFALN